MKNDGKDIPVSEVIEFYVHYTGINPQVLLTMLELTSGSVRNSKGPIPVDLENALGYASKKGFISQVEQLAGSLASAYYGHQTGLISDDSANSASYALREVIRTLHKKNGTVPVEVEFTQTFSDMFGAPLEGILAVDPDEPDAPDAPTFFLPWQSQHTWYYTGGPHCGWGTGCTPYSAVDFAPGPDTYGGCEWQSWEEVRPATSGYVIYAGHNLVKIHHSSNIFGSAWQTLYYHVRSIQVTEEQWVTTATNLGYPSCKSASGGTALGVHLHFAFLKDGYYKTANRKILSGWRIWKGDTEYNGTMVKDGVTKTADVHKTSDNAITR
jgi:murein DD-endopeptidase MepM/ murein hydrolase activator NlpD